MNQYVDWVMQWPLLSAAVWGVVLGLILGAAKPKKNAPATAGASG